MSTQLDVIQLSKQVADDRLRDSRRLPTRNHSTHLRATEVAIDRIPSAFCQ